MGNPRSIPLHSSDNPRPAVMAGIASVSDRERSLEQTLASLAPQVDKIRLSLNGYRVKPRFLRKFPTVVATLRPDGGLGDAEKFSGVDGWDGVVVTCDDDLLYPADYVARLLEGLDQHGHDRIVGFHGGTTDGWTAGVHGAASKKRIRCLGALAADDPDVNVLGTGALAYDARVVPIWPGVFRSANMADVHLACHAHRMGIPMVALSHKAGWLKDICPDGSPSIYESNRRSDGTVRDTRANRRAELDRVDWSAPVRRPRVRVSVATCDRAHLLDGLLDDLDREALDVDLEVAVFEDPADADYVSAQARVERTGWSWHRLPVRMGKIGFWQLVTRQIAECRQSDADWFVFLPDDVRLVPHALGRAIDTWAHLEDPATLTLWRLKDHEDSSSWTGVLPVDQGAAFEVFHVDGNFLCRRDTLEFFSWACPRPRRIAARDRKRASSGVGRIMSIRLHGAGRRMYRVAQTLATPVHREPSVMNPHVTDRQHEWVAL